MTHAPTFTFSCSAVVVLPHHFGPSMSTAPEEANSKLKCSSAVLLRYSISFIIWFVCKDTASEWNNKTKYAVFVFISECSLSYPKMLISCELRISFGIFVAFRLVFLRHFVWCFCGKSFGIFVNNKKKSGGSVQLLPYFMLILQRQRGASALLFFYYSLSLVSR